MREVKNLNERSQNPEREKSKLMVTQKQCFWDGFPTLSERHPFPHQRRINVEKGHFEPVEKSFYPFPHFQFSTGSN
ncbi:MAG: hypothetical protein CVU00_01225 [Bacteroidetes bacterium HGW-Bacteroidetes-17]|nr:MAG: hypothetical protein CVU00_01225 [Bacteroidetes bacterium HGW-Bacteroidetes-17]